MNSGLQCLFATPSMVRHFCAIKENVECRPVMKINPEKANSQEELIELKNYDKNTSQEDISMSPVNIGTNPILDPSNQKIALEDVNKSESTAIDHCIIKAKCDE